MSGTFTSAVTPRRGGDLLDLSPVIPVVVIDEVDQAVPLARAPARWGSRRRDHPPDGRGAGRDEVVPRGGERRRGIPPGCFRAVPAPAVLSDGWGLCGERRQLSGPPERRLRRRLPADAEGRRGGRGLGRGRGPGRGCRVPSSRTRAKARNSPRVCRCDDAQWTTCATRGLRWSAGIALSAVSGECASAQPPHASNENSLLGPPPSRVLRQ